jgi:uncharacterized membrane protein YhaH (DUF805 family)
MSETAQDAWFYTRDGQRQGPVPFSELRGIALDPRMDMVWTQGMDAWKPAGEIDGLFEKKTVEKPESLAPTADPYQPPREDASQATMIPADKWPGVRRRVYIPLGFTLPLFLGWMLGFAAGFVQSSIGKEVASILMFLSNIMPFAFMLVFGLMRLTNLGMSRWWFLANLVPILNFWIGYRCFACPAGYAVHRKMDGVGIFLAILYWVLTALIIASIILTIAVIAGAMGNPDLQKQIEESLRAMSEQSAKP